MARFIFKVGMARTPIRLGMARFRCQTSCSRSWMVMFMYQEINLSRYGVCCCQGQSKDQGLMGLVHIHAPTCCECDGIRLDGWKEVDGGGTLDSTCLSRVLIALDGFQVLGCR